MRMSLRALLILFYTNVIFSQGPENIAQEYKYPFDFDHDNNKVVLIIKPESPQSFAEELSVPVNFSSFGINTFIHRFNHKLYAKLILPHGGLKIHLYAFCKQGLDREQGADYFYALFRMFTRRIKSTNAIDAPDVTFLIGKLPSLISHLFRSPEEESRSAQRSIHHLLYDQLSTNFEALQEDPDKFLNNISSAICSSFFKKYLNNDDMISVDKLRFSAIQLTDKCLSKMIWDISEGRHIWENFKLTLVAILKLQQSHIVNDRDEIKDLIDTAVIRFCYFVDMAGASLSMDFYKAVHNDLQKNIPGIDDFEEELESISSLREIIQATMIDNVSKAIAKNKFGIIARS